MQFIRSYRSATSAWTAANPKRVTTIRLLFRLFICLIFLPGLLTLIGYIVESAVYIPSRRTNYHTQYFGIAAYLAAPLILIRWYWRWPQHAGKLDFVIYALQTIAFFLTLDHTSLSGNDLYQSNSFIREQFKSEQFLKITTEKDTWQWLEDVMDYVYDRNDTYTAFSRKLSGRMTMGTAIRIRQNRVKRRNCTALFTKLSFAGSESCYPMFTKDTEDRDAYGDYVRFHYYNKTVNSTTGYPISMEAHIVDGDFGTYPLAGFWVWFSPPLDVQGARLMLEVMQKSNWIDDQTRAIGFDMGILLLDFVDKPLWANLNFVVEVNKAGKFVPHHPQVDLNFLAHYEEDYDPESIYGWYFTQLVTGVNLNSLERCQPVVVLRLLLQPMYLGFLPFVLYSVVLAVIQCVQDWRRFLNRPFNATDMLWSAMILAAMGFILQSLRYVDCGSSVFEQTMFDPIIGTDWNTTSAIRYALRFEFLQVASVWTSARRLLGVAVFIHVFNFLKFLVRLKALGVLVRTLRFAALDLCSFSFSFVVLFTGFVVMFYHIYSIEASGFRTITTTVSTLWLGMLGELELTPELWRGGTITVALFIIFTFLSAFVLLTTIVSIISTAHEEARKYDMKIPHMRASRKSTGGGGLPGVDGQATFARLSENEESEDEQRMIGEHEIVSRTLRKWKSSLGGQRQGRKVGILNSALQHAPVEGGYDDGCSHSSDYTTASATNSRVNLFMSPASPPGDREGDGPLDAGHWVDLKPVPMATDSETVTRERHTNSATSAV